MATVIQSLRCDYDQLDLSKSTIHRCLQQAGRTLLRHLEARSHRSFGTFEIHRIHGMELNYTSLRRLFEPLDRLGVRKRWYAEPFNTGAVAMDGTRYRLGAVDLDDPD